MYLLLSVTEPLVTGQLPDIAGGSQTRRENKRAGRAGGSIFFPMVNKLFYSLLKVLKSQTFPWGSGGRGGGNIYSLRSEKQSDQEDSIPCSCVSIQWVDQESQTLSCSSHREEMPIFTRTSESPADWSTHQRILLGRPKQWVVCITAATPGLFASGAAETLEACDLCQFL